MFKISELVFGKLIKEVGFYNENVKKEFLKLKRKNPTLYRWVEKGMKKLERNPIVGIRIDPIPRYYLQHYPTIDNLWKLPLPKGWRLLYTIRMNAVRVISIVLEWPDHKTYERRLR